MKQISKKQGILALTFENSDDYEKIKEDDKISISGLMIFHQTNLLNVN